MLKKEKKKKKKRITCKKNNLLISEISLTCSLVNFSIMCNKSCYTVGDSIVLSGRPISLNF